MGHQELSIPAIANAIPTEADAYLFLENLRWRDGKPDTCPHCGGVGRTHFLKPQDGSTGRKTRTGANSQRRVWFCGHCRKQFSVLTDTIFHGTKISIRTWIFVIYEMCASKNGVSAREIERKYNLTAKSAWFMLHRIREAMKPGQPLASLLSGVVSADETRIGGKRSNQSKAKRAQGPQGWERFNVKQDKPIVLSLIDTKTGEVRSQVIRDVTGATLRKAMADQVDLGNTTLVTDEWQAYKQLRGELAGHETVNHSADEYVNESGYTTNYSEGYFGQLKRSIDGTHHKISRDHLPRYLAQFDWMYTHCKDSVTARMRRLLGQVGGRRLTYRPLIGG